MRQVACSLVERDGSVKHLRFAPMLHGLDIIQVGDDLIDVVVVVSNPPTP
jgi:hypothetical protein